MQWWEQEMHNRLQCACVFLGLYRLQSGPKHYCGQDWRNSLHQDSTDWAGDAVGDV